MIKVEHISKQFKKVKAVDDVSLEVKKGSAKEMTSQYPNKLSLYPARQSSPLQSRTDNL